MTEAEIVPGAVAYFEVARLHADARVQVTGRAQAAAGPAVVSLTARDGPFVCSSVQAGVSTWLPLTTQAKPQRTRIDPAWVQNGYAELAAGEAYLQDGANTYTGPNEFFVHAASGEAPFTGGRRPHINAAGVAAIGKVIQQQAKHAHAYQRTQ